MPRLPMMTRTILGPDGNPINEGDPRRELSEALNEILAKYAHDPDAVQVLIGALVGLSAVSWKRRGGSRESLMRVIGQVWDADNAGGNRLPI